MDGFKSEVLETAAEGANGEKLNLSKLTNTILKLEELDKNLYRCD
jgi:hypothetical protein